MEINSDNNDKSFMMKCNASDLGGGIEIGRCNLTSVLSSNKTTHWIIYGSKHIFSTNTTYQFSNFDVRFKNYNHVFYRIILTLNNVLIEFQDANNTCNVNNEYIVQALADFNSTETIYHNVCVGAKHSSSAYVAVVIIIMIITVVTILLCAVKANKIKSRTRINSQDLF
ncbi:hypothetical protein RF11_14130 [Thelohanellus kitauei]|uniref:Uncharacterized protein n=1 Tax=Thelohanellus kitauei TaxID=669202 RepID=A0A0C2N7Q4_THEKT|nr:hypothetical protein RF11_14130 [Thelohanellus kitauei]